MKRIMIFGKNHTITEQKSEKDGIEFKNNKIVITSYKRSTDSLLGEFLTGLLCSQLQKIYYGIKKGRRVEIFGDLNFEVAGKIDNKKERVAKFKGDKILVKLNAIALPKSALKYIIVHEIAHIFTKRHTEKFWKIVKAIYPSYEKGQKLLMKYGSTLSSSIPLPLDAVEESTEPNLKC